MMMCTAHSDVLESYVPWYLLLHVKLYVSGHKGGPVLLPGFAIIFNSKTILQDWCTFVH